MHSAEARTLGHSGSCCALRLLLGTLYAHHIIWRNEVAVEPLVTAMLAARGRSGSSCCDGLSHALLAISGTCDVRAVELEAWRQDTAPRTQAVHSRAARRSDAISNMCAGSVLVADSGRCACTRHLHDVQCPASGRAWGLESEVTVHER